MDGDTTTETIPLSNESLLKAIFKSCKTSETQMGRLSSEVAGLTAQVSGLTTQLSQLQSQFSIMSADNQELREQLSSLQQKFEDQCKDTNEVKLQGTIAANNANAAVDQAIEATQSLKKAQFINVRERDAMSSKMKANGDTMLRLFGNGATEDLVKAIKENKKEEVTEFFDLDKDWIAETIPLGRLQADGALTFAVRVRGSKEEAMARKDKIKKALEKMNWKTTQLTNTFERAFNQSKDWILTTLQKLEKKGYAEQMEYFTTNSKLFIRRGGKVFEYPMWQHFPHFNDSSEFLRLVQKKITHITIESCEEALDSAVEAPYISGRLMKPISNWKTYGTVPMPSAQYCGEPHSTPKRQSTSDNKHGRDSWESGNPAAKKNQNKGAPSTSH